LFGRSWDEVAGGSFPSLFIPEDRQSATTLLNQVALGESVRGRELRISGKGNALLTLELSAGPVLGGGGAIEGISLTARDITERKLWEEHQRLLINELNHRVKNTLATVQSVVSQTLRNAATASDAQAAVEARLVALSRAHDVLTRENWGSASLKEIVTEAIAPYYHSREGRLHVSGPDRRLPPRMALALAMALQELATNAVKYGALSNNTGEIRIEWALQRESGTTTLDLTWTERGGPPVTPPKRRGFGTRLIERGLALELGGEVTIEFAPAGVTCAVHAPIA
jgi:PAS domain S-box-containing protein